MNIPFEPEEIEETKDEEVEQENDNDQGTDVEEQVSESVAVRRPRPRPRRPTFRRRLDAPQYQNIRVAYNGGPETFLARLHGFLDDGIHALITWQWDTTGGTDEVLISDIVETISPNIPGGRRLTRSMTRNFNVRNRRNV